MSTSSQILLSSIDGSIELLILSGSGAILASLGYFNTSVSSALSKALYKMFIPALVFGSVLETASASIGKLVSSDAKSGSAQDIWIPLATAAALFLITSIIAFPLTYLLGSRKQEAVRRALFACLFLGNANTMPLIVMQSLCDTFAPIEGRYCYPKSMGYASLFLAVVNVATWTFLFQYLSCAPDTKASDSEETRLLTETALEEGSGLKVAPDRGKTIEMEYPISKTLLSPPFVSVIVAFTLSMIPGVANLFLSEEGILKPVLITSNVLGKVVVPISCMLVGAELFRSFATNSQSGPYFEVEDSEKFGVIEFLVVPLVRMILLPFIGRTIFKFSEISSRVNNDILSLFMLVEFNVPTANNTVIMINIVAESLPRLGRQLRQDVSKCIFWQFLLTPIFLTLNTAAALNLLFPSSSQ